MNDRDAVQSWRWPSRTPVRVLRRWVFLVTVSTMTVSGCRTGLNYTDPMGPRYSADLVPRSEGLMSLPETLKLVSFNIAFGVHVDSAIALLKSNHAVREADVLLLQEVDAEATRLIANAIGAAYVYYPAVHSLRTTRDFGNAVLTRWPIIDDQKLILPHRSWISRTQRAATAVTIEVGKTQIRVYSVHLGTLFEIGPGARRDQLRVVLDDAERYSHVVVGGDMNSHGIGDTAVDRGFDWPTKQGPRTTIFGRWDHLFVKGLGAPGNWAAGTVIDVRESSDHRPVWTILVLE